MKAAVPSSPVPPVAKRFDTRTIAVVIIALLLVFSLARSLFRHHDNQYELVAGKVTQALQADDVEAVRKYQNAETATLVTAARVGRGSDALAPLGQLKSVKETAADPDTRVHQFDLTFDKGTLHETIRFDPDGKIVAFRYDPPVAP